jgi:hypothetical protein
LISLAEFAFMSKGRQVAGVVEKGRFFPVDFFQTIKMDLRSPFSGSKVNKVGGAFAAGKSQTLALGPKSRT